MSENFNWWQEGVIYQIYPRSFSDSNGDGLGDLPGIAANLDYLAGLGVDAIWLSPFFPTPDADFGYDVSNYVDVDPRFGTLKDFDDLLEAAHQRGIRVILDLVLNHTSHQHSWFIESASSRENPKRDWYIWRDAAAGGGVPTNWQAAFGGSAWEFDSHTGQYYLHSFLREQPDVNWRSPALREAMLNVFRFWLDRGVDGFRLDVFNAYFKDAQFRNNPKKFGLRSFDRQLHVYDMNQPELIDFLRELRRLLDSYPGRYAVGETYVTALKETMQFVGDERLHAVFTFDYFNNLSYPWNAAWISERTNRRDIAFENADAWPTTVLGNHDQPRPASRYCTSENDDRPAFIAMALLMTVRGTPFLYYGDEIGMRDIQLSRNEILDPPGKKYWPVYKGRDGCRSPMQWSDENVAGFSTGVPWLKIHPNYKNRNVAKQQAEGRSLLNFTRSLTGLRRRYKALRKGDFRVFFRSDTGVLAYERRFENQRILVYLNFTGATRVASFVRDSNPADAVMLLSSVGRKEFYTSYNQFVLNPFEVLIVEVRPGLE